MVAGYFCVQETFFLRIIYLWLCWVLVAAPAFLQLQRGYSLVVRGLLVAVASLVAEDRLRARGLQ